MSSYKFVNYSWDDAKAASLDPVGRLIYRFVHMATTPGMVPDARGASPFAGMVGNPVTTGVFFVVAGYYIAYYTGLLRKDHGAPPAAI